jgi:hypothetical protein
MPTALARTTVTHTAPVNEWLMTAAQRWPDERNPRELMLHLMDEGARTLRERELEAAYADAYADWDASGEAMVWDTASGDGLRNAE